jgi:hypothetical protein
MKQKNQIVLLVVLVVLAAVVWVWVSRTSTANSGGVSVAQNYAPLAVENPAPHIWKLENSRKTEYKSAGRNPFSEIAPPSAEEIKRAAQEQAQTQQQQAQVNVPPPPPELPPNLKFFGYGVVPVGTGRLAFFSDGNDVFIVGEGDVLMGRYRIVKINNANLEFEEVGTGRRGSTILQDQGSGLAG